MSQYVYAKHPPHPAMGACGDTFSQALGTCCENCARGMTCKSQALGAAGGGSSLVFMVGAGLALWWALSRKPKPRRNPSSGRRDRATIGRFIGKSGAALTSRDIHHASVHGSKSVQAAARRITDAGRRAMLRQLG